MNCITKIAKMLVETSKKMVIRHKHSEPPKGEKYWYISLTGEPDYYYLEGDTSDEVSDIQYILL